MLSTHAEGESRIAKNKKLDKSAHRTHLLIESKKASNFLDNVEMFQFLASFIGRISVKEAETLVFNIAALLKTRWKVIPRI